MALPWIVAIACVALIAFGVSFWEAASRRSRLGRALSSLDASCDERRVTVTGVLTVAGTPCHRFEDGAAAAVATATAVHGEVSVHAERLKIDELILEGPMRVVLGSREVRTGTGLLALDAAVRMRIDADLHGSVILRSLAAGDRVRARGVVTRSATTEGYRAPGVWHMRGDEAGPVELAFEGWPRRIGPIGASLRGVRNRRVLRGAAIAVILLLASVAALATSRLWIRSQAPARIELDCGDLEKRYREERDRAAVCSRDDDCTSERRGDFWYDLDGCWRFSGSDTRARAAADALADRWLSARCARSFESCREPLPPMCWRDRCTEQPPYPVPATWSRYQLHRILWLFVPPGLETTGGEWLVHNRFRIEWKSADLVTRLHLGYASSRPETCKEHFWQWQDPRCKHLRIHGQRVLLLEEEQPPVRTIIADGTYTHERNRRRHRMQAYFPEAPCPPGACEAVAPSTTGIELTIECADPIACANGRIMLESIEFFPAK